MGAWVGLELTEPLSLIFQQMRLCQCFVYFKGKAMAERTTKELVVYYN